MKNKWERYASNLLKSEIARKGWTYEDFNQQLTKVGAQKASLHTFRNVLSNGKFSLTFFLQCMAVLEVSTIRLTPFPTD